MKAGRKERKIGSKEARKERKGKERKGKEEGRKIGS